MERLIRVKTGWVMWYLDFYDYPTYNWEIPTHMEDWETHPFPRGPVSRKRGKKGETKMGSLMGEEVPFEILPPLEPNWRDHHHLIAVSQGDRFAMGVCSCGKVFVDGFIGAHSDYESKCELIHWENIASVATGPGVAIGLRRDGKVSVVGWKRSLFSKWRDIQQVSAGDELALGVRADGTVIAAGNKELAQAVSAWDDIVQASVGDGYVLGVRRDGTVVLAGHAYINWCSDPSAWTDVVQVSAGPYHAVGLRSDGTVIAAETEEFYERSYDMECLGVTEWKNVRQVCAGNGITAALLADGRVIVARNEKDDPEQPLRQVPHIPSSTSMECRDAVMISVNRHWDGTDEVLALDARGRAITCRDKRAFPWDNWD